MKQPPFAFSVDKSGFTFSVCPNLAGAIQAARDRADGYPLPSLGITAWFEDGTSRDVPWQRLITEGENGEERFISDDDADALALALFGPRRVTFAEYMNLRDPDQRLVLHHGIVNKRPDKTCTEALMKSHLMGIIDRATGYEALRDTCGVCAHGMPYQPVPDFELWVAGVGLTTKQRSDATPRDGYLQGCPN